MKKLAVEALGTGLLAFTAVSSGGNPFAMAAILAIAILAWGGISGGHFNLAVTISMCIRKQISCLNAIKYIIAQIIGVIVAFSIVNSFNDNSNIITLGSVVGDIIPSSITTEFIASAVLLFAIFASINNKISTAWGVGLAYIVLVPLGFLINPSITLASFLNGAPLTTVVVLVIAQIIGAVFATKLDEYINKQ